MKKKLENIGLPSEQVKLYLSLLEQGKQTQSDLSRTTNINRTSLYPHLKELLLLGLISQSRVGERTVYFAEPPRKLESLIRQREKSLKSAMPDLTKIYETNSHTPKTRLFQGEEGLRQIHFEIADTANYIKTFFYPDGFLSVLSFKDSRYYHRTISKRGISQQGLCLDTKQNRQLVKEAAGEPGIKTKFLDREFNFEIQATMFNQQIVFFSWPNRFAVAIDSNEIKSFHEKLFDSLWVKSKI